MVLVIFIALLLVCILCCCANNSKITVNHIFVLLLNIYQFNSVAGLLSSEPNLNFFNYPVSFWFGFFWASIVATLISLYTFWTECSKLKNNEQDISDKTYKILRNILISAIILLLIYLAHVMQSYYSENNIAESNNNTQNSTWEQYKNQMERLGH